MKTIGTMLLLTLLTTAVVAQNSFKNKQLAFSRVKEAYQQKWVTLQKELRDAKINTKFQAYLAAFKQEGKLQLWLKNENQDKFQLFKTYDFCAHSGTLGPKVMEGDGQTPEGFYKINVFNPMSNFHLSLGIDYPNAVDKLRTGKDRRTGGDIYIHGNCVTIGCIPLTDEKIKELYVLMVEARNAGQSIIPVAIFPFQMTETNMKKYGAQFPQYLTFWQTLQLAYIHFEKYKTLPTITQEKGNYQVK